MQDRRPELRDPEFGYKLARLRERLAEAPGRSLWLFLGSSRSSYGICPEAMDQTSCPHAPVVFNFAVTGAGPVHELLEMRRLLARGIRPEHAIIEIMPPLLFQDEQWHEFRWLRPQTLTWADLKLVRRYANEPWSTQWHWLQARLAPCYAQRFCIVSYYIPSWLPWANRQDGWLGLDRSGWLKYYRAQVDADEHAKGLAFAWQQYEYTLSRFHIASGPDRALRELLTLCQSEGIGATLLLMPEGSTFREWYTPQARQELDKYLQNLQAAFGVSLVDGRAWCRDEDFFDNHHLLPGGAADFTRRLGRMLWSQHEPRVTETHSTP